jgi:uncharacterized protein YhaN
MQIRELHIDGFGIFHNALIKEFRPGINVIFGPNEYGKTTLLEFIRKVLFGFKKRNGDSNDYSPVHGGNLGGKIVCELANQSNVTISRFEANRGGKINITVNSEFFNTEEKLESILGYASSDLYRNIFAFTLDELQEFGSLKVNDVKDRIYGAGLGLGSKSISQVEKQFKETKENLFKPKGKVQPISILGNEIVDLNLAISETQENLEHYDKLKSKVKRLGSNKQQVLDQTNRFESNKKHLENLLDLYPVYIDWKSAKEKLKKLINLPDLPQNSMETLERLKAESNSIQNTIEEEREEFDHKKIERQALSDNEKVLENSDTFITLQNMTEQVRSAIQDSTTVGIEKDQLDDQIQVEIKKLGNGWDQGMVSRFEITDTLTEQINNHRETLEEIRIKISRAKDKLESFRETKAKELSQGIQVPEWLKVISYSLLTLGLLGLSWGLYSLDYGFLLFSLIILSIGVVSVRMIVKAKTTLVKEDLQGPEYTEQLSKCMDESDKGRFAWKTWLKDKNFDELLSPLAAIKTLSTLKEIKNLFNQRQDMNQRLDKMEQTKKKAINLIEEIKPYLPGNSHVEDIITNIEVLHKVYEEALKNHEKQNSITLQLEGIQRKITRLEELLSNKRKEIINFIERANAKTEIEFEETFRSVEEKNSLEKVADEKLDLIRSRVGLGDSFQNFLNIIENSAPEELRQQIESVSTKLDGLHTERDQIHKELGEAENQINVLTSNKELLNLLYQKEVKREQLNKLSKDWTINQVALFMLEQAKVNYEKERQPSVIQSAQKIFSQITNGKYQRIFKPLDSDEILADESSGLRKKVNEMSRGSREQLYLAMRLGLIEEYETRSEPLPIIMDDVLVNFDDSRGKKVLEILSSFAENRQVIILTCHKHTVEVYREFGSHFVNF